MPTTKLPKEVLVTSSTGICKDVNGNYFLHVIIADDEYSGREREDIFAPMNKRQAKAYSKEFSLEISNDDGEITSETLNVIEGIADTNSNLPVKIGKKIAELVLEMESMKTQHLYHLSVRWNMLRAQYNVLTEIATG